MLYQFMPEINPEPWAVGTSYVGRVNGKMRSGVSPNLKLKAYQQAVREMLDPEEYSHAEPFKAGQSLSVHFYFWRQLDSYTLTSGSAQEGHVADTTNLQKALEDALQGSVFVNDRNNVDIHSRIIEQKTDTIPCLFWSVESDWDTPFDHQCRGKFAYDLYKNWIETRHLGGVISNDW